MIEEGEKLRKMLITDNEKVKFLVRGDVKPPKRDAGYDAGIDVYMPNLTEQFLVDFAQKNPAFF